MTIYVNEQPLRLFVGARVGEAILRFSEREFREVLARRKSVTDQSGHPLGLHGRVADGDQLKIKQA
jgi:hypothetical protein